MCKRSTAAAAVDHKLGFDTVFSMANIMYLLKESKVYKNGPTFGYLIFSFFPIVAAKEDIVVWLEKGKIKFRLFVAFWPVGHTISEEESQSALSVSQSSNSGPFAFFFPLAFDSIARCCCEARISLPLCYNFNDVEEIK